MAANKQYIARHSTFKGGNNNLPLPPNLKTDKKAILDVLHNHYLVAQISWPYHEIISAVSRLNVTLITLRLKTSFVAITRPARLTNIDDGLVIDDEPEPGIPSHVE